MILTKGLYLLSPAPSWPPTAPGQGFLSLSGPAAVAELLRLAPSPQPVGPAQGWVTGEEIPTEGFCPFPATPYPQQSVPIYDSCE